MPTGRLVGLWSTEGPQGRPNAGTGPSNGTMMIGSRMAAKSCPRTSVHPAQSPPGPQVDDARPRQDLRPPSRARHRPLKERIGQDPSDLVQVASGRGGLTERLQFQRSVDIKSGTQPVVQAGFVHRHLAPPWYGSKVDVRAGNAPLNGETRASGPTLMARSPPSRAGCRGADVDTYVPPPPPRTVRRSPRGRPSRLWTNFCARHVLLPTNAASSFANQPPGRGDRPDRSWTVVLEPDGALSQRRPCPPSGECVVTGPCAVTGAVAKQAAANAHGQRAKTVQL
jgi:hypothetical protein